MRKCDHDNYIPSWASGKKSPYCTGCTDSVGILTEEEKYQTEKLQSEWDKRLENTPT